MESLGTLRVVPRYAERVWGGQRLKPASPPIGEAWIVWEENEIASGPLAGRTLGHVAAEHGVALLGARVVRQTGHRFPLLIKLLDTADWLSVQVHPNDEQAVRLEGPGHFGKTEAWHILEAEDGAQIICGLRPDTSGEMLTAAIKAGNVTDLAQYLPVQVGDTVFVAAGTMHALGPGMLLYEVQQTSDITYRVFDWNRPQAAGRSLHLDQSIAVTNPEAAPPATRLPRLDDGASVTLTTCPYFELNMLGAHSQVVELNTEDETFHAVTVIDGMATLETAHGTESLTRFDTVIVPANTGSYRIRPTGEFRALLSRVP
jgi:mannose-6-phosphate isomerase